MHATTQLPFFVYGTLRQSHGNFRTFPHGSVIDITDGHVDGAKMYASGIPFVTLDGSDSRVIGEIITVDPAQYIKALARVDALEGYSGPSAPNLYDRVIVTAQTANGPVKAHMYTVAADSRFISLADFVPTGDYNDHCAARYAH